MPKNKPVLGILSMGTQERQKEESNGEGAGRQHELTSEIVERRENLIVKGHLGPRKAEIIF